MARERDLPPLIDFSDAVDNIEQSVDVDADDADETEDRSVGANVADHLASLREDLDRLEDRGDEQGREGVLDDIDDTLLSLREALDDDSEADQYAEGIQNRIRQYRANREAGSGTLTLSEAGLERNGTSVDVAQRAGETVSLRGTLVNGGDDADALAVLTFYGEDGRVCRTVESYQQDVGADERRDVDTTVYVPPTAAYYAVRAADADSGSGTIAGEEPVPEDLDRGAAGEGNSGTGSEPATDAWDDAGEDDERPASERSAEEITDGKR